MKNKYTQKQKEKAIERYRYGNNGSDISKSNCIQKTAVYGWIQFFEIKNQYIICLYSFFKNK